MAVKVNPLFEQEFNCKVSDLVNSLPPADAGEEGSKMYVWDDTTKELTYIFKKVFGVWHKI